MACSKRVKVIEDIRAAEEEDKYAKMPSPKVGTAGGQDVDSFDPTDPSWAISYATLVALCECFGSMFMTGPFVFFFILLGWSHSLFGYLLFEASSRRVKALEDRCNKVTSSCDDESDTFRTRLTNPKRAPQYANLMALLATLLLCLSAVQDGFNFFVFLCGLLNAFFTFLQFKTSSHRVKVLEDWLEPPPPNAATETETGIELA